MNYFKPMNISYDAKRPDFGPKKLEIRRTLNDCKDIFNNQLEVKKVLEKENPVLVEVYMAPIPEEAEHLMILMTRVYPGKIGREFFMTKGHIHKSATPEVYITIRGEGKLLLQTLEDNIYINNMKEGEINYIPPGWAHRAVNIGSDELIFLGIYPADSGRDYSFVGEGRKNFGKLVIEDNDGSVKIVDNPLW